MSLGAEVAERDDRGDAALLDAGSVRSKTTFLNSLDRAYRI